MKVEKETLLKLEILTRGVEFTNNSLIKAREDRAKGQNLVYNMPLNSKTSRPQELFIKGEDGYVTVASCVAPTGVSESVKIDIDEQGNLVAFINKVQFQGVEITYVKEPKYYDKKLKNGDLIKKYVSACGYDELNILPWKGCAIKEGCKFCGVNTVANKNDSELFTAFTISDDHSIWKNNKEPYIKNLNESINIALKDQCYDKHAHIILISGNLNDDSLDVQADIYSDIAKNIKKHVKDKATEGIVAVMTPPKDLNKLLDMKESGIDIVVFNLEVGNEPWFSKYCPGKSSLGQSFFNERLEESIDIYGVGNVWTNFVFGLEPTDKLLDVCYKLAEKGIVAGANILHLDHGHRLDCSVPKKEDVLYFFNELGKIYKKYNFKPYYCQKALRTSLANEAYDNRIKSEESN